MCSFVSFLHLEQNTSTTISNKAESAAADSLRFICIINVLIGIRE